MRWCLWGGMGHDLGKTMKTLAFSSICVDFQGGSLFSYKTERQTNLMGGSSILRHE